jgi:tRNA threonylcarbamoyladenosine biosynthesis protein TsaB
LAYILNIETATKNCSVSLGFKDKVIDTIEYADTGYSHAEKLHVYIDELLKKNAIQLSQLNAVAVSKGPGSYTGLRIGVSAAKGLAYALNIPLIAISTLYSLAKQVNLGENIYIIPVLDARRLEVYSAVYDQNHNQIRDVQANLLDQEPFNKYLEEKKVVFIGDAVEKTSQQIKHQNAVFQNVKYPSAKEMVPMAYQKYQTEKFENTAYFEPYYLKDFMITTKKAT